MVPPSPRDSKTARPSGCVAVLVCLVDHGAGRDEGLDQFRMLPLGREMEWGPAGPIGKRDKIAEREPLAHALEVTLESG
jgi:hypothetical protein